MTKYQNGSKAPLPTTVLALAKCVEKKTPAFIRKKSPPVLPLGFYRYQNGYNIFFKIFPLFQDPFGHQKHGRKRNTPKQTLAKFAERTSLGGIPIINVVRKTSRKIVWSALFVIMTLITFGHLTLLILTFIKVFELGPLYYVFLVLLV